MIFGSERWTPTPRLISFHFLSSGSTSMYAHKLPSFCNGPFLSSFYLFLQPRTFLLGSGVGVEYPAPPLENGTPLNRYG